MSLLDDRPNPHRNPYVRPLFLIVATLLAGLALSRTDWGETPLLMRDGHGRQFSKSGMLRIDLPGFLYLEGYLWATAPPASPAWFVQFNRGFIVFLAGLVVVVWHINRIRQIAAERRIVPGTCPSCGYDLRATRDRCPECGTPIGDFGGSGC